MHDEQVNPNDLATRALILGGAALGLNFMSFLIAIWPVVGLLAMPITIAALVCSVQAVKRGGEANKAMSGQSNAAMAGMVLGILTVPAGLLNVVMAMLGALNTLIWGGVMVAAALS